MENKKMFIVNKEKAREIIDSDRCTNCGKYYVVKDVDTQ